MISNQPPRIGIRMKTRPLVTASRRLTRPVFAAIVALVIALLCGGPRVLAAKAPAAVIDLTKETPTQTTNSYNLGPTGALGWMHVEAGMTEKSRQILVTDVEKGSPADGKLEAGDVILGVFGKPFAEDARKSFGRAIGQAETEDGPRRPAAHRLAQGKSQDVELKLQLMGTYSDTSPYNCPKAKKILDQGLAAYGQELREGKQPPHQRIGAVRLRRPEHHRPGAQERQGSRRQTHPRLKRCGRIPAKAA